MRSEYLFLALLATSNVALAQSSCQAVYADSVRNVDSYTRVLSEQNSTFSMHCEVNGSLKKESTGLDLTVPVKGINIGFNGTRDEATQRMQQFCKTHAASLNRFDGTYQLSNKVVVDALQSFNQCMLFENKRISISHLATDTRNLVVRVGLNPATDVLTLNSVQYDPRAAKCRTNIGGEGPPKVIDANFVQTKATGPFSVACERTAAKNAAGDEFFPRLELILDTNHGAYPVVMATEGVYGYDTANSTRQRILAGEQEKAVLTQQVANLTRKMQNPSIIMQSATQGEKRVAVACPQHGGSLATYIASVCKGIASPPLVTRTIRGDTCGYTTSVWSCTTYPE
jgi:hypothetical protein